MPSQTFGPVSQIPFWDSGLVNTDSLGNSLPGTYPGDYPVFSKLPWDVVTLNGKPLPGYCEVESRSGRTIKRLQANGDDGALLKVRGYQAAEITIRCFLWTPDQFQSFIDTIRLVWPRRGKPPAGGLLDPATNKSEEPPIEIYHPSLALWGIHQIVIAECDTPKQGKTFGERVFTIKAVEWSLPIAVKAQPSTKARKPGEIKNERAQNFDPAKPPKNAPPPAPPSQTDAGFTPAPKGGILLTGSF